MNIQAITNQHAIQEISQVIDKIATCLNTIVSDIEIFDYEYWPREFMDSKLRDLPVNLNGSIESVPFIKKKRLHDKTGVTGPIGYGLVTYESRLNPELKYVIYTIIGKDWDESFLCAKKQDVFKLYRNALRQNKEVDLILPPILPDGVLEDMIENTINFLRKADVISEYGVRIKRGIIIDGEPGNGKTMLCRYIQKLCTQNNIKWGVVTASEIESAFADKELSRLFTTFTVTFFDDIDISYMNRQNGNGKIACSLLTAMDGMNETENLVRIFTTNEKINDLDPAFVRPGRIDKCITIEKPNEILRRKLVETVWPQSITSNIDVNELVTRTNNLSFAEIEAIRTSLVTHFVFNNEWNLNYAFDRIVKHKNKPNMKNNSTKVGFN